MSRGIHGLRPWLQQRFSALYMALFTLYLAVHLLLSGPMPADAWRQWLARPHVALLFALFFAALLLHAWIGIRDVLLDYVHPLALRLPLLGLLILALGASGFWLFYLLLGNLMRGAA